MKDKEDFDATADISLGVLMFLIVVVGIPGTATALRFFLTKDHRNENNTFFDRLYQVTSGLDLVTCLSIVPVIAIAFSSGRQLAEKLQETPVFREFWVVVWGSIPQCSSFLVAMVSISRLVILHLPNKKLRPSLAYIIPAMYFVLNLLIITVCLGSGMSVIKCKKRLMQCVAHPPRIGQKNSSNTSGTTQNSKMPPEDISLRLYGQLISWIAIEVIQLSIPVILVIGSCVMSVWKLSHHAANTVGGAASSERSSRASTTVVIFTVVFIICNLPLLLLHYHKVLFLVEMNKNPASDVAGTYKSAYRGNVLYNYLEVVCRAALIGLNSAINPLVFFWRVEPFRRYLRAGCTRKGIRSIATSRSDASRSSAVADREGKEAVPFTERNDGENPQV